MSFATDSPGARAEKIWGLLDETAPSTDTAESGLNGRLQRIAQRLTTIAALSGYSAPATFTPAAASHTAGDVNGGAQTFALGAPANSVFRVDTISLLIASGTNETTAWTLHLYNVTPPSALADDAAWDLPSGDRASYLGSLAIAQVVDVGSTLYQIAHNNNASFKLGASGNLFGYLVNGTTLTPQAVAHTVTLTGHAL